MNSPKLQFRLWSSSDSLDELTWLLCQAYAPLGAAGLNYTAVNQTADVTQSRISKGQCLLALMEGVMVGSVVVAPPRTQSLCPHFNQPDVASINQFAVLPTYQGSGIGSSLLEQGEAWARAKGYQRMALDTAESAHDLIYYYTNRGYSPVCHVQWPGKNYRSVVLGKSL